MRINDRSKVEVTHINLNDNTIEGLRFKNFPGMSVQYHPEASPGPHDSVLPVRPVYGNGEAG
jgi:carbamoyl-phosphate synthase small subunit